MRRGNLKTLKSENPHVALTLPRLLSNGPLSGPIPTQSLEMDEMRKRSENGLERWGANLEEIVKMDQKL